MPAVINLGAEAGGSTSIVKHIRNLNDFGCGIRGSSPLTGGLPPSCPATSADCVAVLTYTWRSVYLMLTQN